MYSPAPALTESQRELLTKAYQQELEDLQRLTRELIKKHPELAGFEEREIPDFLRKHESLTVIKARIAKSTTEFSKVIRLP